MCRAERAMNIIHAIRILWGMALVAGATACNPPTLPTNDSAVERAGATTISAGELQRTTKVAGQRVYVPVYSHINHMNNEVFNLTTTLSIRNTDDKSNIYIRSAKYYDTQGKPIREYINGAVRLPPLATLEYIIGINDTTGGSGANFIVEWMSDKPVTDPVIECVMVGTQSQQGVSLISAGRPLD